MPPRSTLMSTVFALTALTAATLYAQVPAPAPAQPPTFKSGVEVVVIDVSVGDRSGKPVARLEPNDFTVIVDGAARRVMTAQFVNHHATATPLPDAPGAADEPPPPSLPFRGRDVAIIIDEDSLELGDGMFAKRAATAFLDRLGPADRIGVNVIPRLRSNFTITADREVARRAIANWVPGGSQDLQSAYLIGLYEAFEIERNDLNTMQTVIARECPADTRGRVDQTCSRQVVVEARQVALRAHTRGTLTLQALQTLGRGLRQISGPKTVVLISGGIPTPESMSSYGAIEAEFAAAQITLYTMFFEKMEQSTARGRQSPTMAEDDRIETFGLENVASATGGVIVRMIGSPEASFERVATELSASYLLGIEVAPSDRNGRPHQVQVKVSRSNVDVRGRKQYVIPADKAPSPQK